MKKKIKKDIKIHIDASFEGALDILMTPIKEIKANGIKRRNK